MSASLRAIDAANVVVLVLDVSEGEQTGRGGAAVKRGKAEDEEAALLSRVRGLVHQQDLAIAKRVTDEGRALVIAVNKVDALEKEERTVVLRGLRLYFDAALPQVKTVPLIPVSALSGLHLPTLLPAVVHTYERWDRRVPTSKLNAFVQALQTYRPHPSYKGQRLKVKYMMQTTSRPPTFAVWVGGGGGGLEGVSEEWMRMMKGMLVKEFALEGVGVRLKLRRGEVKDREERRTLARKRDAAEEGQVRAASLEVEEEEVDEDDVDEVEEGLEVAIGDEDLPVDDFRVSALGEAVIEGEVEEQCEEDEDEWDEEENVDEGEVEKRRPTPPLDQGRVPFVPFEEDAGRQREVAIVHPPPVVASHPIPAGFMSPAPLPSPSVSALTRRFPRSSRLSALSFLPLPPPPAPSTSLPWAERLPLQRAKQKRRSEAIAKKKAVKGFVSEAAWRKWTAAEEERQERWKRRDRKMQRGREKKAGRGQREEDAEVGRWAEGRGEKPGAGGSEDEMGPLPVRSPRTRRLARRGWQTGRQ